MDGMFNLGMYGLVSPQERNDDLKKKSQFFIEKDSKEDPCLFPPLLPMRENV